MPSTTFTSVFEKVWNIKNNTVDEPKDQKNTKDANKHVACLRCNKLFSTFHAADQHLSATLCGAIKF